MDVVVVVVILIFLAFRAPLSNPLNAAGVQSVFVELRFPRALNSLAVELTASDSRQPFLWWTSMVHCHLG